MRWIKVAAIAVGILIAFLVVGSVVGFILHVVTYLVIAEREVREPEYTKPLPRADVEPVATSYPSQPARPNTQDIDDELAKLKREMGS
jgi:hypothetical protein